jgi:hypothetical protein
MTFSLHSAPAAGPPSSLSICFPPLLYAGEHGRRLRRRFRLDSGSTGARRGSMFAQTFRIMEVHGVSLGAPVETGMTERSESPRRERSSEPLVPESCDETVRPSRSVDRGSCGPGMGSRKDRLGSADAIQDWRKATFCEPRGARLARAPRDRRPRARREASCLGTGRSRVHLRGRFRRLRHEARRA